jgi:uncharacterized membrane protein YdjX (TVP38/TMEM64 family)
MEHLDQGPEAAADRAGQASLHSAHEGRKHIVLDGRRLQRVRLVLTAVLVLGAGLVYLVSPTTREQINYAAAMLAQGDVRALRDYILSFGLWAPVISALLMILQTLIAPLPAFLLAFANGLAFGVWWGGLLTFGSATLASAISFWLARALGRPAVEALVGKSGIELADRWFARRGALAVLIARLIPIVSFDVVSYAAGLTRMHFLSFLVATMVGITPATFLYAYLGEQAPQFVTVLLIAFGIVIVVTILAALRRRYKHYRT